MTLVLVTCSHLDELGLGQLVSWFHLESGLQTLLEHRASHGGPVLLRHPPVCWLHREEREGEKVKAKEPAGRTRNQSSALPG